MTWFEESLYTILPDGVYIRCCRVSYPDAVPGVPRRYNVSLLQLRRSWWKKSLVLRHSGYLVNRADYPHHGYVFRSTADTEARALHSRREYWYLESGKLTEEAAVEMLRSEHLLEYAGFDPGMALPGEDRCDTIRRLVPAEALLNIQTLLEFM